MTRRGTLPPSCPQHVGYLAGSCFACAYEAQKRDEAPATTKRRASLLSTSDSAKAFMPIPLRSRGLGPFVR